MSEYMCVCLCVCGGRSLPPLNSRTTHPDDRSIDGNQKRSTYTHTIPQTKSPPPKREHKHAPRGGRLDGAFRRGVLIGQVRDIGLPGAFDEEVPFPEPVHELLEVDHAVGVFWMMIFVVFWFVWWVG